MSMHERARSKRFRIVVKRVVTENFEVPAKTQKDAVAKFREVYPTESIFEVFQWKEPIDFGDEVPF